MIPVSDLSGLNIVAGIIIGVLVFEAYNAICLYISGRSIREVLALSFKGNLLVLIIIIIFSEIVINLLFYKFSYGNRFFAAAIFAYLLLLLAAIDFKTQFLPDIVTKPLIILGIVQGYMGIFTDLQSSVLGAVLGYGLLWGVNYCFRLVRGMDGMGYGDFKLLSAICAWTGIKMLPLIVLTSSIIGIFVALVIIRLTKADIQSPTPFGPSLVLTGFIALIYGNDIIDWYLKLLQI